MSIQNFRPIPTITVANDYWEIKKWRFNVPEITVGAGATPQPIDVTVKGIGAVTLVNAINDGLLSLTLFGDTEQLPETYLDTVTLSGGCEQSLLPDTYQLYTSVEANGITYEYSSQNLTQIPCKRIADNVFGLYNYTTKVFISEV